MQNVNSVPCRYFGQGNCRRGSRCPYAHIFSPSTSAEASAHHQEEQFGDARSRTLCKFYLLGTCFKGSHCPYRHAIEEADPLRHEDPAVQNDYFRQLTHGSLVQFQEGGSVSDLSVLQDYSAVRIDGLLPRCTRQSVADVLQKHSFDVQLDDVRVVTNLVRGKVSAFVTCRDRSFAGEFRTTSRAADLNEIGSSESEVHVVQPRLPYGTSTKSCRKVVISLGQAPDVARLYFEDQGCAERASQHFESDDPTEATVIERWIVVLRNVHDLDNALAALADQPDFVHLWPANLDHDIEDTPILVESLLTHIGPVVFTMRSKPDTRKFKAVAVFEHDSNALTAVQDLHDQPQECLSYQPLLQQLISSSQLRVASHIFNALREQIDTKIQAWQDQYVTLRTSSKGGSSRRFVVLTIEGPDPKLVADATRAVESILAGKVLVEKGAPLWRPSLMANGAAYRTIQHLRSQYSVCLTLNKVTHQINYFGPEEDHEVVQQAAIERLREFSDSTHIVELDVATFAWTCREGLNLVREVLGEERISVDIASTPKRVIVTGTEEQYDLAKLILGLEQTSISSASEEKESDPDCSVCWTLAEDAVTLECQHVYCLSCFEGLCMSAGDSTTGFLITCQGEEGGCRKTVSLTDLHTHLSSSVLGRLLEKSLKSYVLRHSDQFQYCPSPDCNTIFRTNCGMQTCSGCLQRICTDCQDQHDRMTCADFKYLRSGDREEFQQYREAMKIKDCPKCNTPIEKVEGGCNHITCGGCGTHMCWVCLETFDGGLAVYEHMTAEHGGFGFVVPAEGDGVGGW